MCMVIIHEPGARVKIGLLPGTGVFAPELLFLVTHVSVIKSCLYHPGLAIFTAVHRDIVGPHYPGGLQVPTLTVAGGCSNPTAVCHVRKPLSKT